MEFFIAVLIPVFWIAIGAGITLAVVRGIRKRRLKAELNPLAGAADVYNEALIGKTGTTELRESFQNGEEVK